MPPKLLLGSPQADPCILLRLLPAPERDKGIQKQKRRAIVVGLDLKSAKVELHCLLEVALLEAEFGMKSIRLIAIGIQRKRLLEGGNGLGAAPTGHQSETAGCMRVGQVGI